jgi:predicted membrane channel-forming protein YqfA (hemolysin III family)
MDKEWSLTAVVVFVIVGAIGAFLASRYRPWLLGAVLLVVGVFFAGQYAELLDPSVGPAIRREAGAFYVLMSWSGLLFVLAGAVIGLVLRRRIRAPTKTH